MITNNLCTIYLCHQKQKRLANEILQRSVWDYMEIQWNRGGDLSFMLGRFLVFIMSFITYDLRLKTTMFEPEIISFIPISRN